MPSMLSDYEDIETGIITPGMWRNDVPTSSWLNFFPSCSNNFSNEARAIREEYNEFFNNEGAVTWQWRMCGIKGSFI